MDFRAINTIVFAFSITMFSFGQSNCNCNIGSYSEKIELLNTRDSLEVFELSAELKKTKQKICKFKALEIEFNYFIAQLNKEKAFAVLNELEDYLGRINCESDLKFNIYLNKAKYFKLHNNYEKLSEFAFKALKEAEYLKDSNKEIEAIKQIVYLFTRMDEDDKNWQYIKRAEKLIFKQSNPIQSVKNFRWLAFEYETKYTRTKRKSLLDSLFIFANQSKKGATKRNIFDELALSYRALEAYSYHKGNAKNALKYIDSAIFYAKKIKGKKNLSGLYISKAWDHLDLGEKELAVKWMDTSFAHDTKNDIAGFMMHHLDATDLYELAGRLDKAFASYKIHSRIKDSIFNTERTQVINELETKYKTELKDAKIKRLNVLLVIALLIIVSILLAGSVIQLKRTRKKNKILKRAIEEQERLEKELYEVRDNISKDFHDDLGNKLARISLLSNLVNRDKQVKNESIKQKIKQITDDANDLYMGTRDFIFSLKENSDYVEELATYLSDFGESYFKKTDIKFKLKKQIASNAKLPFYWSKQLILIFKEAMTNTLKHAQCKHVALSFVYDNKSLTITCVDDGIGIKKEDLESPNGLFHIKQRAEKIGGSLTVESVEGKGTKVCFYGNIET